ncbi:hypothetical protein C4J94_2607 [Pseudomonas sp. R5-89-07]|nr:hypothetical protein C4J94_2607 [Pseudomonas sp. R5-89-07]
MLEQLGAQLKRRLGHRIAHVEDRRLECAELIDLGDGGEHIGFDTHVGHDCIGFAAVRFYIGHYRLQLVQAPAADRYAVVLAGKTPRQGCTQPGNRADPGNPHH